MAQATEPSLHQSEKYCSVCSSRHPVRIDYNIQKDV